MNNEFFNNLLAYFMGTPPPYNPIYDLNSDGIITVLDLLLYLMKL